MKCQRCNSHMVEHELHDPQGSVRFASVMRCLMCGEHIDQIIQANRAQSGADRVSGEIEEVGLRK